MRHQGVLLRLTERVSRRLDEYDHLPEPGAAPPWQEGEEGREESEAERESFDRFLELLVAHGARSRRLAPRVAATPDELRALDATAIGRWERSEREAGRDADEVAALRRRQERRVGRSLTQ